MTRRTNVLLIALLLSACAGHAQMRSSEVLPPPQSKGGAWFCCDAAGVCVIASGACGEGQTLVWCNEVRKNEDDVEECLD